MKNNTTQVTNKIITIPNILSLIRILLIPFFIWLYLIKENYLIASIVLIISGLTDILDGFIARKFNLITEVGKVLDPVADKLTQASVLFCLVVRFDYMLVPLIILVIKELTLLVLGLILYNNSKYIIGALWHGKIAALGLYLMLFTHLIWGIWDEIPKSISFSTFSLAISLMILSLILYIKKYIELFKNRN